MARILSWNDSSQAYSFSTCQQHTYTVEFCDVTLLRTHASTCDCNSNAYLDAVEDLVHELDARVLELHLRHLQLLVVLGDERVDGDEHGSFCYDAESCFSVSYRFGDPASTAATVLRMLGALVTVLQIIVIVILYSTIVAKVLKSDRKMESSRHFGTK